MREENITTENNAEDEPSGMHELVFLPEKKKCVKQSSRSAISRYYRIPRFRSIRFNLWTTFMSMTVAMLAFIWLYELIFYSTLYVYFQENNLYSLGQTFTDNYVDYSQNNPEKLDSYIAEYAESNEVNIVVFTLVDDGSAEALFASTPNTGVVASGLEGTLLTYYLDMLKSYNVDYVSNTSNLSGVTSNMVIYGFKTNINNETHYIYMSSLLPTFGKTQNALTGQLAIVTIVCIVAGVVVAYFGAGIAARPMRELTLEVVSTTVDGKHEPLDTNTKLAEINELSAAFNKAFDDIENNNRFRRDLLANVSHDMKTPLTMIRAYSEMIRDISGGNKEKCVKQAQVIIDETDRLTALISEVIELSKLEAGVLELHVGVVDISEKLLTTVANFGIMEEAKGYIFATDIESNVLVRADSDNIDRVIYNLMGNAMNYTGEDKTVTTRCHVCGKVARIEIIDSGKGMSEEELLDVWDKYYRLAQDKRSVVGSGLGLSIVKSILDLHGVTYGVASEKGKGSNFWFELPLVDGDDK